MKHTDRLARKLRERRYASGLEAVTQALLRFGISRGDQTALNLDESEQVMKRFTAMLHFNSGRGSEWPSEDLDIVRSHFRLAARSLGDARAVSLWSNDGESIGVEVPVAQLLTNAFDELVTPGGVGLLVSTPDASDGFCADWYRVGDFMGYEISAWGSLSGVQPRRAVPSMSLTPERTCLEILELGSEDYTGLDEILSLPLRSGFEYPLEERRSVVQTSVSHLLRHGLIELHAGTPYEPGPETIDSESIASQFSALFDWHPDSGRRIWFVNTAAGDAVVLDRDPMPLYSATEPSSDERPMSEVDPSDEKLDELEFWALENAVEDEGFVSQMAGVAARLTDIPAEAAAELIDRGRGALEKLLDLGLIEIGRASDDRPMVASEAKAAMLDYETWLPVNLVDRDALTYFSTDLGASFFDELCGLSDE